MGCTCTNNFIVSGSVPTLACNSRVWLGSRCSEYRQRWLSWSRCRALKPWDPGIRSARTASAFSRPPSSINIHSASGVVEIRWDSLCSRVDFSCHIGCWMLSLSLILRILQDNFVHGKYGGSSKVLASPELGQTRCCSRQLCWHASVMQPPGLQSGAVWMFLYWSNPRNPACTHCGAASVRGPCRAGGDRVCIYLHLLSRLACSVAFKTVDDMAMQMTFNDMMQWPTQFGAWRHRHLAMMEQGCILRRAGHRAQVPGLVSLPSLRLLLHCVRRLVKAPASWGVACWQGQCASGSESLLAAPCETVSNGVTGLSPQLASLDSAVHEIIEKCEHIYFTSVSLSRQCCQLSPRTWSRVCHWGKSPARLSGFYEEPGHVTSWFRCAYDLISYWNQEFSSQRCKLRTIIGPLKG